MNVCIELLNLETRRWREVHQQWFPSPGSKEGCQVEENYLMLEKNWEEEELRPEDLMSSGRDESRPTVRGRSTRCLYRRRAHLVGI